MQFFNCDGRVHGSGQKKKAQSDMKRFSGQPPPNKQGVVSLALSGNGDQLVAVVQRDEEGGAKLLYFPLPRHHTISRSEYVANYLAFSIGDIKRYYEFFLVRIREYCNHLLSTFVVSETSERTRAHLEQLFTAEYVDSFLSFSCSFTKSWLFQFYTCFLWFAQVGDLSNEYGISSIPEKVGNAAKKKLGMFASISGKFFKRSSSSKENFK